MIIYFLSGENRAAENVIGKNAEFFFFSKIGAFLQAVRKKPPKLVFADFYFFGEEYFNLKDFFKEQKNSTPVLYFNSPNPEENKRFDYYLCQILSRIPAAEQEIYKKSAELFCERLASLENSEENSTDNFLYRLKKEQNISEKNFNLLRFLYFSQRAVSAEEIQTHFEEMNSPFSEGALQVALSRLRHSIAQSEEVKMDLLKENGGYKLVMLEKK